MKLKRKWPWILLGISVLFVAAGLASGEFRSVLEKAATICLECIGIG
jgi:hypothetical protein